MTILFAGTSLADFDQLQNCTAHTTAANIAPYVSEGVRVNGTGGLKTTVFTGQSELWISFYLNYWDAGSGNEILKLENAAGEGVLLLDTTASGTHGFRSEVFFSGTGTTAVVTGGKTLPEGTRYRVDLHFKADDSAGVADVYIDGSLYTTYSGDTARITDPDTVRVSFYAANGLSDFDVSAVIVSTIDTRGMEFVQRKPTGNGTETDWTGTYTDIDENGFDDGDKLEADTNGDTSTFTFAALPGALSGYDVEAVVVATRALAGANSNLRSVARVGGTVYQSSDTGNPVSAGPAQFTLAVNPDTSSAWTISEVDAAEFGVRLTT